MKVVVALATLALSQAAFAQTPECRLIQDPGARLACYDGAAPPSRITDQTAPQQKVQAQKAAPKLVAPTSKVDTGAFVDSITAEDARMNSRLHTICRGC